MNIGHGLTLSEVKDDSILDSIYALRVAAWRGKVEIAPHLTHWADEFDAAARHWVVWRGNQVVAAARLSLHSEIAEVPDAEGSRQRTA